MSKNIKHDIEQIISDHGTSAPLYELSARIGWNSKWERRVFQELSAKAAKLIAEAAEIIEKIELDEEEERKLERQYKMDPR